MTKNLWTRARNCMPGGVNSPVRAFGAVGGEPVFMESALGAYLYDCNQKKYLDLLGSWGPMILGHSHPSIVQALQKQLEKGTSFGTCSPLEVELAELVKEFFPSMELLRLVNSGTEATLSAIRLARGYTGRNSILKFRGCYHGHGDAFLIQAGSGALTHGVPSSLGVTEAMAMHTLVADFNHLEQVTDIFSRQGEQIACVILEPVVGNMGVVPPAPGFLEGVQRLCKASGALLVFDEVMTGFRLAPGGAQELYSVKPDLTTLGKVLGGGLPMGAYGGQREIMEKISPLGGVYQAGTLSGNPLAVCAGLTQLRLLQNLKPWQSLEIIGKEAETVLVEKAKRYGVSLTVNRVGSMLTPFFHCGPVYDSATAMAADPKAYGKFFQGLLKEGVHAAPSQFEAWFFSTAHKNAELELFTEAVDRALSQM